jgi:hypothetical protein
VKGLIDSVLYVSVCVSESSNGMGRGRYVSAIRCSVMLDGLWGWGNERTAGVGAEVG